MPGNWGGIIGLARPHSKFPSGGNSLGFVAGCEVELDRNKTLQVRLFFSQSHCSNRGLVIGGELETELERRIFFGGSKRQNPTPSVGVGHKQVPAPLAL
jgi:hypothetical protein